MSQLTILAKIACSLSNIHQLKKDRNHLDIKQLLRILSISLWKAAYIGSMFIKGILALYIRQKSFGIKFEIGSKWLVIFAKMFGQFKIVWNFSRKLDLKFFVQWHPGLNRRKPYKAVAQHTKHSSYILL